MNLDLRSPLAISGLVLLSLVLTGCSDDPESPGNDRGDPLLTFELGDYFVKMFAEEGIVFVSNSGGEVLDVATWSGPSTVEIRGDGARPDTVSFTFVRGDADYVDLSTEVGIPAGTVVRFDGGYPSNPTGEAELVLTNAPEHDNYLIASSLAGVRPPIPFATRQTIRVHWDAVDVFVRIDPVGGWPHGGWCWGVRPGETRTMDLAEPGTLAPLIRHATRVPTGGNSATAALNYVVRAGLTMQAFSFSHDNYYDDAIPDSVIMYGPNLNPEYQTSSFYHRIEGDPDVFFALETRGNVPTEFSKMPGTLDIRSAVPDAAVFAMTGDWDRFTASWYWYADLRAEWYVEGRAPISAYALPQLPPEVMELAPDLVRAEFALSYLRVEDETQPGVTHSQGVVMPIAKDADRNDAAWPRLRGLPPHVWN